MMFTEIFREAWAALGRNPVRSLLTMTGISWGIVAVTLLLSYGSGFRNVLMYTFEVFGKGAVVCWPGTTSEQAGGERAGKAVRFEQEDADWVKAQSPLVKRVTLETVKFKGISHEERLVGYRDPRRLSRIWRDAQRSAAGRPLDFARRYRRAAARGFPGRNPAKEIIQRNAGDWRNGAHRRREIYRGRLHGHKIFRQQLFYQRRRIGIYSLHRGWRFVGRALRQCDAV